MPVTAPVTEYEVIPIGEYAMQVVDIQLADGQFGKQLKWTLEIVGNTQFAGKQRMAWTPLEITPRNKTRRWVQAFGFDPEAGTEFDMEQLIGQRAVAILLVQTSAKDGSEFNKIEEIKAPKKRTQAVPVTGPKATQTDNGNYDPNEDVFANE